MQARSFGLVTTDANAAEVTALVSQCHHSGEGEGVPAPAKARDAVLSDSAAAASDCITVVSNMWCNRTVSTCTSVSQSRVLR